MADDGPCDDAVWLTVDRGNTTLDCMLVGAGRAERGRLAPTRQALASFLGATRPTCAAAVTVVASGLDVVADELEARGARLLRAGDELPCPLRLAYRTPGTLGADRWVAATAAHERFGAALVVDCGSAITVDAVTEEGVFLGGAIAPGLAALAAGLAAAAPALPGARLDGELEVPPATSSDAVTAGIRLGFVGLVEGIVRRIAHATGLEAAPVVLTGGDAGVLTRDAEMCFEHVDDLVHSGLRCLLRASRS